VNYPFNDGSGNQFSSTGFFPQVQIIEAKEKGWSQEKISEVNKLASGLFISATVQSDFDDSGPTYAALTPAVATPDYLQNFLESGKPKVSYSSKVKTRFPNINKGIAFSDLPGADQTKWKKIMQELVRVGNRTVVTPKSLLIMDQEKATQASIDFEKTGRVSDLGAWTIAVKGTATRHGFAHVPCAEFMSEVIRQAYKRAGSSHFEDFGTKNNNTLSYSNGAAAVVNLSTFLYRAGWVAWDPQIYIPPTGAVMMHASGNSPGHTYMSAGDQGRFIIDNGSPQGRDLRKTALKTLQIMYQHGVFFLPPGYNPKKWAN
jgi:hypothetical protein